MGEAGRVERERRGTHPEVLCRADELVLGVSVGKGREGFQRVTRWPFPVCLGPQSVEGECGRCRVGLRESSDRPPTSHSNEAGYPAVLVEDLIPALGGQVSEETGEM